VVKTISGESGRRKRTFLAGGYKVDVWGKYTDRYWGGEGRIKQSRKSHTPLLFRNEQGSNLYQPKKTGTTALAVHY